MFSDYKKQLKKRKILYKKRKSRNLIQIYILYVHCTYNYVFCDLTDGQTWRKLL